MRGRAGTLTLLLTIMLALLVQHSTGQADPLGKAPLTEQAKSDAHLARCLDWMLTDYPSGLEETACAAYFALPSSFLFKCARAQKLGFQSITQRRACVLFFAKASEDAQSGYVRR